MLLSFDEGLVDKEHFDAEQAWLFERHDEHEKAYKTEFCNWYWLPENYDAFTIDEIVHIVHHLGLRTRAYTTRTVMTAMIESAMRGVPYYPKCKKEELLQFAAARGLASGRGRNIKKQLLVQRLEQSDKHPSFTKFEMLPPEIRNKIYCFHFRCFSTRLYAPAQPPITLVNRLIREESLPLFYNVCCFGIPLLCGGNMAMPAPRAESNIPLDLARQLHTGGHLLEEISDEPADGVCDREHHHINTDDIEEYEVLPGHQTFALLAKSMVKWHSQVYCKYHREFSEVAVILPHACIDLHFGFDKKENEMDYYVHGHCDRAGHEDDCELRLETAETFASCWEDIQERGYLDMALLRDLWSLVDEC